VPDDKGGEDATDRLMGGPVAGDPRPGEYGPRTEPELAPGKGTGLGHDQRILAADAGVRAARPEALDGAVHEPRVGDPHVFVPESPRVGLPRLEALEYHIGRSQQVVHVLLPGRGGQVGDEALLATVPHQPGGWHRRTEPV